jgi:hypothetical protein
MRQKIVRVRNVILALVKLEASIYDKSINELFAHSVSLGMSPKTILEEHNISLLGSV